MDVSGLFSADDITNEKPWSTGLTLWNHTTMSWSHSGDSRNSGSSLVQTVILRRDVET